jgi:hypothetical protein
MNSGMQDAKTTDSAEFGPFVDAFEPMRQGEKINLAAGIVLPIVGIIIAAIGLYGLSQSQLWGGFCLSAGVIAVPIGIWGYISTRRSTQDGYKVYRDGLIATENGVPHSIAWDDIAIFYSIEFERFSRNKFNFNRDKESSMGIYHFYRIQTVDGETLKFDDQILRAKQLGEIIAGETAPRLRPNIQKRFAAGETLSFGGIDVNQEVITIPKKKPLAWADISVFLVEWERARLIIEETGNPVKWAKIDLARIGNLELFLELAEAQLPIEIEYGATPE